MKINRRRLALHEAGHSVMAVIVGMPMAQVTVVENDTSLGRVEPRNTLLGRHEVVYTYEATGDKQLGDNYIKVCYAGVLSEIKGGCDSAYRWISADTDMSAAAGMVLSHYAEPEAEERLKVLWDKTAQEISDNWSSVEYVSARLLEKGTLSEREVRKIVSAGG